MAELIIKAADCIGCSLCVRACAVGALTLEDKKAVLGEGCNMCGVCIQSCPKQAIAILRQGDPALLADSRDLWVVAERDSAGVLPVVFELLGQGRRLADQRGCRLCVLLAQAPGRMEATDELIAAGADLVYLCEDQRFDTHLELPFVDIVAQLIQEHAPEIVLFGATDFGRSLAPRVAARCRTGLTADCTELEIDPESNLLRQTRPAFGGNLMATIICPNHRPQMATVRPGVMPAPQRDAARRGEVLSCPAGKARRWGLELLETVSSASASAVAEAEILVVAGRGLGNKKNMRLVEELAAKLGGAVGCSRPLVEAGWCEYSHQVGQTGLTVAPKLLLSFGVSGAIQHLAGISRAETIIAVNNDPEAPIFGVSRYGIVGDCVEVLDELLAALG